MPANAADARLNAWTLAWGADRLPHALRGFWSPPIYYPYPDSLAYIENMLGIAILVAPVHWLSGNPILTYNAALLLSFFLAATGAYLLAREVTGRRDAALVGACAFGFAPYRWAQLPHLQVLFVGWLAVAVWALHRALERSRGRWSRSRPWPCPFRRCRMATRPIKPPWPFPSSSAGRRSRIARPARWSSAWRRQRSS